MSITVSFALNGEQVSAEVESRTLLVDMIRVNALGIRISPGTERYEKNGRRFFRQLFEIARSECPTH